MGQLFSNPNLSTRKDIRIYMQGLWGVGKKSILEKLKVNTKESQGLMGNEIRSATHKNITMMSWDVGGRCYSRPMTRYYFSQGVDALLFVVDSVDDCYYTDQSKFMLSMLMEEEELKDTIFLVLANKQDLPEARSVEAIASELNFVEVTRSHVAYIMGCSAETGEGLQEALDWLAKTLQAKKEREEVEVKAKQGKKSRSLVSYMKGGFQTLMSMMQKSG